MEYDESKKLEVEISQNQFVESRVNEKKRKAPHGKFDILDLAMVPVAIGVFVSLGFLFANLFKATSIVDTLHAVSNALSLF